MKLRLASRSALANENPRSITPFTTLNIVVTPAIPSARTITARAQKLFSLVRTRRPTLRSRRKISVAICVLNAQVGGRFGSSDERRFQRGRLAEKRDEREGAISAPNCHTSGSEA